MNMANEINDDEWEEVIIGRLMPYLPSIRRFWEGYGETRFVETGMFPLSYGDLATPAGLMVRTTATPARSPVKGVQAFPFVPARYLRLVSVPGGAAKMLQRVCANGIEHEELVIIERHNMAGTYQRGEIVCAIPKDVMSGARSLGRFVYLTRAEAASLRRGVVEDTLRAKSSRWV